MNIRTLSALALALALPCAAQAAEISGSKATKARLPVIPGAINPKTGTFEIANDRDWYKVRLKKGEWYAFGFNGASPGEFTFAARLRNAAGKVLADDFVIPELEDNGHIIKPTKTGIYFVEVQHASGDVQTKYRLWANTDCPGGFNPECKITVGAKRKSVLTWHDDTHSFAVQLKAGKTYQLTVDGASGINGYVYDPSNENDEIGLDGPPFTVATTGRYVVLVDTGSDNGTVYEITLDEVTAAPIAAAN